MGVGNNHGRTNPHLRKSHTAVHRHPLCLVENYPRLRGVLKTLAADRGVSPRSHRKLRLLSSTLYSLYGHLPGGDVGHNGGIVKVSKCYSTGNIEGRYAGGICGSFADDLHAPVYITHSHSRGDIVSGGCSGGIVGAVPGHRQGYVHIQECYSTGRIPTQYSGGICGSDAGAYKGEVHILDCCFCIAFYWFLLDSVAANMPSVVWKHSVRQFCVGFALRII